MTHGDIIRMAQEAEIFAEGFCNGIGDPEQDDWFGAYNDRFAFLVAAAEREACAQVCDALAEQDTVTNYYRVAALAIRARGHV